MTITAARIAQLRRDARRLRKQADSEGKQLILADALRIVAKREGFESWKSLVGQCAPGPTRSAKLRIDDVVAALEAAGATRVSDEVNPRQDADGLKPFREQRQNPDGGLSQQQRLVAQVITLVRHNGINPMTLQSIRQSMMHVSPPTILRYARPVNRALFKYHLAEFLNRFEQSGIRRQETGEAQLAVGGPCQEPST